MALIPMNELTNERSNWQVQPSPVKVAEYVFKLVLDQAQKAISQRGQFHLVTAGGTTPVAVYQKLKAYEHSSSGSEVDWSKWHIYLGDERCVNPDDPQRNSVMLERAWLKESAIPLHNRHYMAAEKGPEAAAREYETIIKSVHFDLVLLGMGEDGHTASLFPGHSHEKEAGRWVQTEYQSPKPPAERVTLSAKALSRSHFLVKMITGENKQKAVKQWLEGQPLPIATIEGEQTEVVISREALPARDQLKRRLIFY